MKKLLLAVLMLTVLGVGATKQDLIDRLNNSGDYEAIGQPLLQVPTKVGMEGIANQYFVYVIEKQDTTSVWKKMLKM